MAYCETFEEWTAIIEYQEGLQGSNLDDPDAIIPDAVVFAAKQRTAQAELEQLLSDRFNIPQIRLANSEYLRYAHAVIIWWHLAINSEIRKIVHAKYRDVVGRLKTLRYIVTESGSRIECDAPPGKSVKRGALLGNRFLPSAASVYQAEQERLYRESWYDGGNPNA